MNVHFFNEDNSGGSAYFPPMPQAQKKPAKKYGFFKFCFDVLMTLITGGFWLIWIFVREMRKR